MSTRPVTVRRNVALRLEDGTVLAANAWLPGEGESSPAIVLTTPYLKDGIYGVSYESRLAWLASQGFAAVIVDFRGTGASAGRKPDCFSKNEGPDVVQAVEAVAAADWCNGRVGVWGRSYGGNMAERAAVGAPSCLGAVVALEPSSDPYIYEQSRYGCRSLGAIDAEWATQMLALGALPPLAGTPEGNDEEVWQEHLEALTPWHHAWCDHPYYDSYWEGRGVQLEGVTTPTLIIAGWRGMNPDGALQDFIDLEGPKRIVIGPWDHGEPEGAELQPIDAMGMVADWFRRFLCDEPDAGRPDLPPVITWAYGDERWEGWSDWPPAGESARLFLNADGSLGPAGAEDPATLSLAPDTTVGTQTGFGTGVRMEDQGPDEERSLCFTGPPLAEGLDLAGAPVLHLLLPDAGPGLDISVRLTEVTTAGESNFVSRGLRRLGNPPPFTAHADPPGDGAVVITLDPVRHRLEAGSRLRLSIAPSDFPAVWPSAEYEPTTISVVVGCADSVIVLPLLSAGDRARVKTLTFDPPNPDAVGEMPESSKQRQVDRDLEAGTVTVTAAGQMSARTTSGAELAVANRYQIGAAESDPAATWLRTETEEKAELTQGTIRVTAKTYCGPGPWTSEVEITRDSEAVFARKWSHPEMHPS